MKSNKRTILVTGGYGFIGSNFIHMILKNNESDVKIINIDANTYASNPQNLQEFVGKENFKSYIGRIEDTDYIDYICRVNNVEGIINFAAESHVDRSIEDFKPFLDTNVVGTLSLLAVAKKLKLKKFLQVSTDEVYGSLDLSSEERFTENSQISPNSPYSAAKAAADGFVRSFYHTHGIPTLITRCSNNYGPYQFTEKLIPLIISSILEGKPLPIYGDGLNVRDWIHVNDHCNAVWRVYEHGKIGEVYNIGSDNEWSNIELVKKIIAFMDKPSTKITYVNDRLGHDRRYAIDSSKIQNELGWYPKISFEEGLKSTIKWYIKQQK